MLCTASTHVVAGPLLLACCALAQGTLPMLLTGSLSTRSRQTTCKMIATNPCGCEETRNLVLSGYPLVCRYALTGREVTAILMQRLVKVDGKVRTDTTYPAGFMDVIQIEKTEEHFRWVSPTRPGHCQVQPEILGLREGLQSLSRITLPCCLESSTRAPSVSACLLGNVSCQHSLQLDAAAANTLLLGCRMLPAGLRCADSLLGFQHARGCCLHAAGCCMTPRGALCPTASARRRQRTSCVR